jgi:hypothetical protein
MSVENPKTVDFVSLGSEPNTALLVVSDHLDWHNSLEHQLTLQEKLNAYLAFIESGDLYRDFPKAAGKRVEIRAVFQFAPDSSGESFLQKAEEAIRRAGFQFSYRVGISLPPPGSNELIELATESEVSAKTFPLKRFS